MRVFGGVRLPAKAREQESRQSGFVRVSLLWRHPNHSQADLGRCSFDLIPRAGEEYLSVQRTGGILGGFVLSFENDFGREKCFIRLNNESGSAVIASNEAALAVPAAVNRIYEFIHP